MANISISHWVIAAMFGFKYSGYNESTNQLCYTLGNKSFYRNWYDGVYEDELLEEVAGEALKWMADMAVRFDKTIVKNG